MGKTTSLIYTYKGIQLPVKVYFERRASSRVSLGKSAILLRVPWVCRGPLLNEQLQWMGNWLEATFQKKPEQFMRLAKSNQPYEDGQTLRLFDGPVSLSINTANRKTAKGQYDHDHRRISITVPEANTFPKDQLSNLISRCLASHYQSHFELKVFDLNQKHFDQPIQEVRLKNNASNWGSCSSNSIINLSTRLLLVPEAVQDYVVIHELAHLIELNHSKKFWALVEEAMPDYYQHENWLKEHGAGLAL